MSALIVTLGAGILSLRRAMAGKCPFVADAANKMASLSLVGLTVGIRAALAGGASALAGGIKAVTSAANFEKAQEAFVTLIGAAAKVSILPPLATSHPQMRAGCPIPLLLWITEWRTAILAV
jgi:Ca2+/H+ antiporter